MTNRSFSFFGLLILSTALLATASAQDLPSHVVFAGSGQPAVNQQPYAGSTAEAERLTMKVGNPFGIEIKDDQWWLSTIDDHSIYQGVLDRDRLKRVAGIGVAGYSGDGGPATEAAFNWPHEVRADAEGNLFVADTRNHVIRRIDGETGIVETIAGNGTPGFAGDGKRGKAVQFQQPHSVVLDGKGGLLVADTGNHRIRRIDLKTGVVQTIAGDGKRRLPDDGDLAETASLSGPRSLAVDDESIWIALREGNSIWRIVRQTGRLQQIAGTGEKGYRGDGGPLHQATFNGPKGLTIAGQGHILVVDTENHAVRLLDLKQDRITTVLGGRAAANTFELARPHGIAYSPQFGYLVADSENHRVIRGQFAGSSTEE